MFCGIIVLRVLKVGLGFTVCFVVLKGYISLTGDRVLESSGKCKHLYTISIFLSIYRYGFLLMEYTKLNLLFRTTTQ